MEDTVVQSGTITPASVVTKFETPDKAIQSARDGGIQKTLAILITVGFFGAIAFMLTEPLPEGGHDALLIMIGSLGTAWGMVVSYYFGSSSGSAAKTALART